MNNSGLLITLEGCSGVGKTFNANLFLDRDDVVVISEISQSIQPNFIDIDILNIINKINRTSDIFFLNAEPKTTFALLLAKYIHNYETIIKPALKEGKSVVCDRGIDSPALLQAILMLSDSYSDTEALEQYQILLKLAGEFVFLPNITLILEDEFSSCLERLVSRERLSPNDAELQFLKRTYDCYSLLGENERIKKVNHKNAYNYLINFI